MFKYVSIIIGASICAPSGVVHAAECNPPQVMCGEDPYSYACPPCAPKAMASQSDAENYRAEMESYRMEIEVGRSRGEIGDVAYAKAIEKYKDGIEDYKSEMDVLRGFSITKGPRKTEDKYSDQNVKSKISEDKSANSVVP